MKKIAPVIIAAIKKDGRFLLTKRIHLDPEDEGFYHGAWQLPGGGMEFGETPEETLRREILEEIGVIVQIETLVPKIYTEVRNRWQGLFIVYLCAIPSSSIIVLNDEASEYGWFTLKEVKKLRYLPLTTQILEDTFKTSVGERT